MNLDNKYFIFFFIFIICIVTFYIPYFEVMAILLVALTSDGAIFSYQRLLMSQEEIETQEKLEFFLIQKREYMDSETWDRKRKTRLQADNYTCQGCGIKNVPMDVHHTSKYKDIPYEPITSLKTLCRDCHNYQHEIYGYPKTLQDYLQWNAPIKKRNENI